LKLLRNKSIVIIMALAAVGLVSRNMILPLFHTIQPLSHVESDEEIAQREGNPFQPIEYMTGKSITMADFKNLGWATDYERDPFMAQTTVDASKESVENADTQVVPGEGEHPRPYVLVAVVQEPGKSLAVINDIIVGEGDYYEDFMVIKIDSDSVVLEGPNGNKTLRFSY
jgi:hypothetical protein